MAKSVTTIPATLSRFTAAPINSTKKRRVAAYARVSTDNEEQLTSYEAQIDYYTNYIKGRDDWEFVGVYPDEGITGTNTKKREQFRQMVADALDDKIDLIITKSVSRFARNTVDSLTTIRKLKEHNVEVYFEKENIWTFDSKGELLLTIMSSLAQEESRSISENCTWGQRKRFADGKVTVPFKRFLGYDMGPDHNLVVNPEQAKLVKRIYGMFLQGQSPFQIARTLTEEGIPSPGGKDHWNPSNIKSILTNEKYKGDALLQKSFTVDFLTKKKKTNEGEIPQYYVKDNHEAIIDPETFEMVQTLMTTDHFIDGLDDRWAGVVSAERRSSGCGVFFGRQGGIKLYKFVFPVFFALIERIRKTAPTNITGQGFLLFRGSLRTLKFQFFQEIDRRHIRPKFCLCAADAQSVIRDAEILRIGFKLPLVFLVCGLFRSGSIGELRPLAVDGDGHRMPLRGSFVYLGL